MRVSAKADYAVRAMIVLAAAEPGEPVKGEAIAEAQAIPLAFVKNILGELRQNGLVHSEQSDGGGYSLAEDATRISVARIVRAVEGPLASVAGEEPNELRYTGDAVPLKPVWLALRANVQSVLEGVSLAQVVANELPPEIRGRTARDPGRAS
jgi:Rrf2 family protein